MYCIIQRGFSWFVRVYDASTSSDVRLVDCDKTVTLQRLYDKTIIVRASDATTSFCHLAVEVCVGLLGVQVCSVPVVARSCHTCSHSEGDGRTISAVLQQPTSRSSFIWHYNSHYFTHLTSSLCDTLRLLGANLWVWNTVEWSPSVKELYRSLKLLSSLYKWHVYKIRMCDLLAAFRTTFAVNCSVMY